MRLLYVSFILSEGIADRGEVSYETWQEWIADAYVFGPYDAIVCVYNTLEGYFEGSGDRETIAHLVNDPADAYDGYWRVVKREVYERYVPTDPDPRRARLAGLPRSYAHPPDELLPPFSDWSVEIGSTISPRSVREVDAYRPGQNQIGNDERD